MTDATTQPSAGPLVRLRRSLKAAAYSGPRRGRWQQPDRLVDGVALRAAALTAEPRGPG